MEPPRGGTSMQSISIPARGGCPITQRSRRGLPVAVSAPTAGRCRRRPAEARGTIPTARSSIKKAGPAGKERVPKGSVADQERRRSSSDHNMLLSCPTPPRRERIWHKRSPARRKLRMRPITYRSRRYPLPSPLHKRGAGPREAGPKGVCGWEWEGDLARTGDFAADDEARA